MTDEGDSVVSEAQRTQGLLAFVDQNMALVREKLWLRVLIGMVLGVFVGLLLSTKAGFLGHGLDVTKDTTRIVADIIADWLALPGHLFLAAIKFVVVPLVFVSVVRGIAGGDDVSTLRQIGPRIVIYFLFTTAVAVTLGSITAYVINPGAFVDPELIKSALSGSGPTVQAPVSDGKFIPVPDRIVAMIPTNPHQTLVQGDMLQIVIAATIIGIALVMAGAAESKPFLDLTAAIQAACMAIVKWVMRFAPIAVFGLICQITARVGLEAIFGITGYVLTVVVGLLLLVVFYLSIVLFFARRSPLEFLSSAREVMLLAFSTSSSAAVMPLSLRTAEEQLHIRPSVARFVVPLGATINMDGTALYQAAAAIFLAQVFGVDIGLSGILLILVTSIGASIGSPGTPGVGIVILATILSSVGIPPAGIALILGVDRILDMCRTAVNVTGDLTACTVMDRMLGARLDKLAAGESSNSN